MLILTMMRSSVDISPNADNVKPSVPGFWLTLALGYSKNLVSHMDVW